MSTEGKWQRYWAGKITVVWPCSEHVSQTDSVEYPLAGYYK